VEKGPRGADEKIPCKKGHLCRKKNERQPLRSEPINDERIEKGKNCPNRQREGKHK